ncbi:aldehyde ferredoxin oxidoreductase family protein [Schnuerera sp. xch1]|uniref:aldehyde ferredoxin oxidoreductase family protein n=1 Tax=Schnuerera sp. xch1 TaxID=2874283 RepID=UPI001CBC59AF|nr:aldehyde ferredoxin oxidoreductase family protein [Schnuerera sp. xch1]MBZ2174158.1 aldehyde ferredoxin oxidoreductase family protein [Schnuerera sp. xch1]
MYDRFSNARILDVDLTKSEINIRTIPGDIYRLYPGGSALGLYLILQDMDPKVEPLSSENMLIFSVSPLTGLPISGTSRVTVTTKSPLTGTIGDSQAGGFFPMHLKANDWDSVLFRGKSEKPVYLYIDGDNVELKDAKNIWGKVTGEVEKIVRQELGEKNVEIAQIGPGGENLVKYASIINMCNRANGRNGTGAVMGSKNLKALVVKKGKALKPYNKEKFSQFSKKVVKMISENPNIEGLGEHGTDGDLEEFSDEGFLPTKNWTTGYFPEGATEITGTTMSETILKKRDTCYGCAVRCKRVVEVPGIVNPLYGGPEYETAAAFGSYCGINDLKAVSLANQLCNMYGIDTISCGATIAFAMECYEKGMLTKKDTDGLELKFGNDKILPELIEKIANREGIGNLLAEGSKRAAQIIGKGTECFTIEVKGQELPAHMPQYKPMVGLIYAVNPFGADHQSSEHDVFLNLPKDSQPIQRLGQIGTYKTYKDPFTIDDDKVRFAFDTQCYFSILDTLNLCQFVWGPSWELCGPDELLELCKLGLGWNTSLFELMRIGERRINMMRYFNARAGFTKEDDKLPKRIFEKMPDGPSEGIQLNEEKFNEAKELYYIFAGWGKDTGNPTESILKKLSLGWLIK